MMQTILPDIHHLSEFYVFQQNTAPTYRACKTVDQLTRESTDFIPPWQTACVVSNAREGIQTKGGSRMLTNFVHIS